MGVNLDIAVFIVHRLFCVSNNIHSMHKCVGLLLSFIFLTTQQEITSSTQALVCGWLGAIDFASDLNRELV